MIFIDKNSSIAEAHLPTLLIDPNRWKLLFWSGPFNDHDTNVVISEWGVDAVIGSGTPHADFKHLSNACDANLCLHELNDRLLIASVAAGHTVSSVNLSRMVFIGPENCLTNNTASLYPYAPLLTATVAIEHALGIRFCLVGIDANIAQFEYPLEWLQATLQEYPCRTSDWVLLSLANGNPDPEVIDLIDNYALVDLVLADRPIYNMRTTVWNSSSGAVLAKFDRTSSRRMKECGNPEEVSLSSSRKGERYTATSKKFFSYTSTGNMIIAVIIAMISGLGVNISFRRALGARERREQESVIS